MLKLIHASFATVKQLFDYKADPDFKLDSFPGYTEDQWGIKAHNRPWINSIGDFRKGQKIIEVGGAYSSLPRFLARKYELESWVGDDFGGYTSESIWTRWGDPKDLPSKFPDTKYVFEPFGKFSESYPSNYFDRIFSVSTLEHIPDNFRLDVFKDMNRCLAKGGMQIHAIDISVPNLTGLGFRKILGDRFPVLRGLSKTFISESQQWISVIRKSGVEISSRIPNSIQLYNRSTHVESTDVVYRFYPPVNAPKRYSPTASLLLIIKKS